MEKKWHYAGNSRGSHHRKATFRPEVRRVNKALGMRLPILQNDSYPLKQTPIYSPSACFFCFLKNNASKNK